MRCFHVNIRQATFLILSIIVNNITIIQMVDDNGKDEVPSSGPPVLEIDDKCPRNVKCTELHPHCNESLPKCNQLPPQCIKCNFNMSCIYGEFMTTTCEPIDTHISCTGQREFKKHLICRYCYQTEPTEHNCTLKANCNSIASPRVHYTTNCTVYDNVTCLGNRKFNKNVLCNWTGGYKWTTALILSITLGGFGADRFYLGHWQEGIGKLFSFGGLGVWTIIDVILISLHYLGPADGSLYI